ncbi:MAG TPA: D-isomer specific 2-hydroxyacid dehydrogenase family protein [Acidimicrobiales bacterium]|nr:D-isomer specific 2-hydroxyacid dehydrogenase family protein [Acidimicrobiales bacterium]
MRIAIGPSDADFATAAVQAGGAQVVPLGQPADGLVWLSPVHLDQLAAALSDQPGIRWVQLPFAGIENAVAHGLIDSGRTWTCAKGSYARPVAEHALMLALAGLRLLPQRVQARTWGAAAGTSLYGARVVILGGGGITVELLRLLDPFGVAATVVRRQAGQPVDGAARVVGPESLPEVLPGARVVFLALALTPATRRIIGSAEMDLIGPGGWLVNVARGGHVDTDAVVEALAAGRLGGAALDVTDPEPLPDGHPLWDEPRCIITPHTADTPEMVLGPLTERITTNVGRFVAGEPMVGLVDPEAGY